MPAPITNRPQAQFPFVAAEDIVPTSTTFLAPPRGMNTQLRLDQMDTATSRLIQNLNIRDGHYLTRDGTTIVGDVSGQPLIYATSVKLSTGKTWHIRWRTGGVDYLLGSTWVPCNGIHYNAPASTQVSITGWNDTIVFTTGVGKLMVLSFPSGVPTVAEINDAPSNVGHVSTFSGRIIASLRNSSDIFWSVKNDSEDWTGQGSGNEPLISSPGGSVDQQTAVIPVSDEYAYCVRTNSVWQMTLTGDPDAPFRFTTLYQGVGCEYPGAVTGIRRGVCFPSRDNIVLITPEGISNIGDGIREKIRISKSLLRDMCSAYDERTNEYVLSVPSANSLNAHTIYRFNLESGERGGGVIQEVYPFPVKSLSFTRYFQSIPINDLTGSINQLPGAINDLGQSDQTVGMLFAMSGSSKLVARSSDVSNNDPERDVNSAGVPVAGGWRVESGYVIPQRTTRKVALVMIELEYESSGPAALTFEYSTDGGAHWYQFAARTAPATNGPRILRVRHTIERDALQFAINCAATPTFRIIAVHVYASSGSSIEDAR